MNILLVDDDRESRAPMAEFLRELGHQVTECKDGEEALTTFKQGEFSLILSDIRMPRMSGIELLQAVSKLSDSMRTHVVLFTGYGDEETAHAARKSGAYGYMLKPINVEQLADIVEGAEDTGL